MIDYTPTLIKELKSLNIKLVLSRFNEKTNVPCIVYQEIINQHRDSSDKREYSDLVYLFKVYDKQLSEVKRISSLLDSKMRSLNFKRTYGSYSQEEEYNVGVFRFNAVTIEHFK